MKETNIIDQILSLYPPKEQKEILYAYEIARENLSTRFRENNNPFIEHPLAVALIVAKEIRLDADAIVAIFLHEGYRFSQYQVCDLSISKEIHEIVDSLNKISDIKPIDTALEAENYKNLIVSYSKDPRVTLIKLADRLDVMRNIHLLPKSSQERKIAETIFLYVPIAHQLGLYNLKSELEEIFFKYTEPHQFRTIRNKLLASKIEREQILDSFIGPLSIKIKESGISAKIKSRTKTPYSIWKKMQKQDIAFEKVEDISAMRIIIDAPRENEVDLCWKVYSIVTEEYSPDVNRLRDWVTSPKSNGYESLHTTVKNQNGYSIEVQIRSERMDDVAENGGASHWSYKGIKGGDQLSNWLTDVRNKLESKEKIEYNCSSNFITDEVFVFTPNGELRKLPQGATVLDFAFDIHSNLGIRCSGGKIGGKLVSIKERLKTGDIIEIITNKNQKVSLDWLNYVITSKARTKIKQKSKEEEYKKAAGGKELLGRRLKNWKMEISDEDITALCKKYKAKTINEFYSFIFEEKIDVSIIKEFLNNKSSEEEKKVDIIVAKPDTKSSSQDFILIDGKFGKIDYKMSKCCNPVYGDEVIGFVSINDGIKIHRISCNNATRLIENYPYRIQKAVWKDSVNTSSFQVALKILVDDASLIGSIISIINDNRVQLRSSTLNQRSNRGRGEFDIIVQISVSNNQQLEKLISLLKKTKGIVSVIRN